MSKLLDLTKQVTLTDAAKHLSRILEEEVTEVGILSLGLNNILLLSVPFVNGVNAHPCKLISKSAPPLSYEDKLGLQRVPFGDETLETSFTSDGALRGLYDLPMVGGTYNFVLDKHQEMTGGPRVNLSNQAVYVNQDATYYELVEWPEGDEDEEYDPRWLDNIPFPEDSQIVVRTSAIKAFEQSIKESDKSELVSKISADNPKTINSLLKIVITMAIKGYTYDPKEKRSKSTGEIVTDAELLGLQIHPDTVCKHLKAGALLLPKENK